MRTNWRRDRSMFGLGGDGMQAGKTRTVIAAGAIGNVLEWYDFAIYGYFATSLRPARLVLS